MLKLNIKSVFPMLILALFSANLAADDSQPSEQIVVATWHEIQSDILKETRRYAVSLPPNYDQNESEHYPVLYVLDGHSVRIKGVVGMVESLSHYDLSQRIPQFIVVAIESDNRNFDMTPTQNDLAYNGEVLQNMKHNSGGARKFSEFIKTELFKDIDSKFRTNDSRGLVGMSLGGLLAADILLNSPNMFSHFLIADATYIWDDNYLNKTFLKSQQVLNDAKANVFIGLANNDHIGEIGIRNRQWGNDFINNLSTINNEQLKVTSKYFADEQHGTVMFLAFYYGLIELYGTN
ncbi:alpha/beta hydrolase [Pseudidiomarina aquimaris]|uniref:alpha/beta hydrolase n=1 Tax=Pseudidiomarina aquimaris TaxID=641841 RepID=UPI0013004118|nr:alpha/beta hydrolase-fold protein [Pseudidiomarina aquimaris]